MIGLILGSAFRRLLDALKWCLERPAIAVAVISLSVAAFYYLKADHLSTALKNARSEIIQLTNERKEAIRYATAEKARLEKEQERLTHEADKKLRIALDDAHARLRAYAKRHAASVSISPAASGQPEADGGEAIVATINDARICTVNTVRLLNAQAWAFDIYGGNQ
jgi:hypothetical protein